MITRHFLTVSASAAAPARRVHYRRCGQGPLLLMVHQSPRSSKEYEGLMRQWGAHFTCVAPDSPGFGQSDPLPGTPEVADFAAGLHAFLDALGVETCLAYGFHSGGIILAHALKQQPQRFHAVAMGGYAVWTEAEMRVFGERYIPAFRPAAYGEHMAWLWNRILEQAWFFPWFDVRNETRLSGAHADLDRVQAIVMEMLDAGDAYRFGYGAVLRAPRDVPGSDAETRPVLISAYAGDPLRDHIDRLGPLPALWRAEKVATPADHHALSLAFLQGHAGGACPALAENAGGGFLPVGDGLIHWAGTRGAQTLVLHGPGAELAPPDADEAAMDLPGHGLSDDFADIPATIEAVREALGAQVVRWPALPPGNPERLYPDLSPQRFGEHLHRAWGMVRARALFQPWYDASAGAALPVDPAALEPAALAARARALLRAWPAARRWHDVLAARETS